MIDFFLGGVCTTLRLRLHLFCLDRYRTSNCRNRHLCRIVLVRFDQRSFTSPLELDLIDAFTFGEFSCDFHIRPRCKTYSNFGCCHFAITQTWGFYLQSWNPSTNPFFLIGNASTGWTMVLSILHRSRTAGIFRMPTCE